MSFASNVKDELCLIEYKYPKDMLSGLLKLGGSLNIHNNKLTLQFKSENSKIAQMVYKKIYSFYDVKPNTSIYKLMKLNKNNVYMLTVEDKVSEIISDLSLNDLDNIPSIIRSENRIYNFLAGCFLASGSINDPNSSNYHLELSFYDESICNIVNRLLNKVNFEPKIIKRRNFYVLYIKKAQQIADFIAHIGATKSYLEFEDVRINRDFYNSDNRLNNCDISNSVRTNIAANKQLEYIKMLDSTIGINHLDANLQCLCYLRLENKEDSMLELANKFNEKNGTSLTKSGINHLFEKIKELAIRYSGGKL